MALGNNQQSQSRTFLSVGFGKLRQRSLASGQKVDETTPKAIKRQTQQGADTWALEYDFINGKIDSIFYKDNSDNKFENTFEVLLRDGIDFYQISFTENSKYWFGFMETLPNIILSEPVNITVFDYINKDKVRKSGINVEQFNNKNTREVEFKDGTIHQYVNSFYKEYTEDKKWKFLNGYPEPMNKMDWKDKDDVKMYFMRVKKFLREEFKRLFSDKFTKSEANSEVISNIEPDNAPDGGGDSDLPF
jgi:hypothetical protein